MSAMVPVTGCSSSQPQITAPEAGRIAAATSPENQWLPSMPVAAWVEISSNCTATRVVLVAGRIPLNWAIRKNSSRPKCTITPTAAVNHQPPNITTTNPKPPAAQPLRSLARGVAVRLLGLPPAGLPSEEASLGGGLGFNVRRRSRTGAPLRPTWPGCRGVACGARWPEPPGDPGPPTGRGCRWHPPGPRGWRC